MKPDPPLVPFMQPRGGTPLERALYLNDLYASVRELQESVGRSLQAAMVDVLESDPDSAARALDVAPVVLSKMAENPDYPNVALMRKGLKIARRLPDLSVTGICEVLEALKIAGATEDETKEIARLLISVAEGCPLDDPMWDRTHPRTKMTFHQAVTYARTLAGDS